MKNLEYMNILCLDINGNYIDNHSPNINSIDDVGAACMDCYRESFTEPLLSMVVLCDDRLNPIGYCSYFIDVAPDCNSPDKKYVNFHINYVFIRQAYRCRKLSLYLSSCIINLALHQVSTDRSVVYYIDSSNYITGEGQLFGEKIRAALREVGLDWLP